MHLKLTDKSTILSPYSFSSTQCLGQNNTRVYKRLSWSRNFIVPLLEFIHFDSVMKMWPRREIEREREKVCDQPLKETGHWIGTSVRKGTLKRHSSVQGTLPPPRRRGFQFRELGSGLGCCGCCDGGGRQPAPKQAAC